MGLSSVSVPMREDRATQACRSSLSGKRKGIRALLPFIGPAFIASIAYMDPGNFATNIQGGAEFGYKLLWVVVMASAMATLIQYMSAKLGIATGRNLPELCRQHFPKWLSISLWIISEFAAMATDLAEFLGATLGLYLLFHIPLIIGTFLTGITTYLILMLERFGFRPLERFITALVLVIGAAYLVETVLSRPSASQILYHSIVPWMGNSNALLLAVGVVGATVMPHVVYLHSGLTQNRVTPNDEQEKHLINRFSRIEVLIALSLAGIINMAMMYMAASVFFNTGHTNIASIPTAYETLRPLLGSAAAGVFLVSLLASGFSSSAVGTMAGQVIMQGFVGFKIPLWVRRVVTMLPTFIIVLLGVNPTETLVISQVLLSIALPAPILTLIYFTRRKDIMGSLVNKSATTIFSSAIALTILFLNVALIYSSLGGSI